MNLENTQNQLHDLPASDLNEVILGGMLIAGQPRRSCPAKDAIVTAELAARVELIRRAREARASKLVASKLVATVEYQAGGRRVHGFTCEGWEV